MVVLNMGSIVSSEKEITASSKPPVLYKRLKTADKPPFKESLGALFDPL